jgi:hypothetical protein
VIRYGVLFGFLVALAFACAAAGACYDTTKKAPPCTVNGGDGCLSARARREEAGRGALMPFLADPVEGDRWARVGDGTEIAVEVADPVEGDSYPVVAVVMGEGRTVEVSNYVLPPYFDRSLTGPTNRMQLPLAPFGLRPGGYYVVLGRDGNESEVFAHVRARGAGIEAAAAKRRKADSRLARRLAAHP